MLRRSLVWVALVTVAVLAVPGSAGGTAILEGLPDYWSGTWDTPFNKIVWQEVSDAAGKKALKEFPVRNGGNKAICPSDSKYFVGTYRNDNGVNGHHAACTSGEAVLGRFRDDTGGAPSGWYRAVVRPGDRCSFKGTLKIDGGSIGTWRGDWVSSEGASGGQSVCAANRASCGRRAVLHQACMAESRRTATAVVRVQGTSIDASWSFSVIGSNVTRATGTVKLIEPGLGGADTTEIRVYGRRKLARYAATDAANRGVRLPITVTSSDAPDCNAGDAGTGNLIDSSRSDEGDAISLTICGRTMKFSENGSSGRVTVTIENA